MIILKMNVEEISRAVLNLFDLSFSSDFSILHVQMFHVFCVFLYVVSSRFDLVAHKEIKRIRSTDSVVYIYF